MNLSRGEQRVLHVLAQGGFIRHEHSSRTRISRVDCVTRDGSLLSDCTLDVFMTLRRKRLVASRDGGPYRISRMGRGVVRPQADNR
ncbi:MAG TPA: YjhX family toxin [Telmatospirillum sp.]|nr:YjhX family toxin [Telmatospirillum sp.]